MKRHSTFDTIFHLTKRLTRLCTGQYNPEAIDDACRLRARKEYNAHLSTSEPNPLTYNQWHIKFLKESIWAIACKHPSVEKFKLD